MKHVFLVNSHTTFLSSIGVINLLKLREEDVILLYARNYSNSVYPVVYKICNVDALYYSANEAFETTDKSLIRSYINKVDDIIRNDISGFFYLYTMNFFNPLVCLLYSSVKCRRISFIQESAQSVVDAYKMDVAFWKGIKRRIKLFLQGVPFRAWPRPCYYRNDYIWKQYRMYSYALNEQIFHGFKAQNKIISWPVLQTNINIDTGATFFICDGWVQHQMCEQDIFLEMMEKLIRENASKFNYIRFHPNQTEAERIAIIQFFKKNRSNYQIMDASVPFESILCSYKNLNIVGMGSALCFFAHDMHHNVVCHDDWLYEKSIRFKDHIDKTGSKLFKDFYNI